MQKVILSDKELKRIQQIELELLAEVDRICEKYSIKYTLGYGTLLGAVRHQGFIPWDDDIDICMLRGDFEKFKLLCEKELSKKYFYQCHETDSEYFYLFDKIRVNDTVFKETFIGKHNIHHGLFIDIFPIDNVPENIHLFKKQYYLFKFYKIGLMVKYVDLNARKGKKFIQALLLRLLYLPFSLEYLYKHAKCIETKYSNTDCKYIYNYVSTHGMSDVFPKWFYTDLYKVNFEGYMFNIPKAYDLVLRVWYGKYMKLPPKEKQVTIHDLLEINIG